MGTTKQGDRIEVTVWHDPRDSYGRKVIPCAKANVARLGLWAGWVTYEADLTDTTDADPGATAQGLAASRVTFRRIR